MKKCSGSVHRFHQHHQQSEQQQQLTGPSCPPAHMGGKPFSTRASGANVSAATTGAKPWPIKLALLLCCICSLLSACSGESSVSLGASGNGDNSLSGGGSSSSSNSPPALSSSGGGGGVFEGESDSDSIDCLFPEDCTIKNLEPLSFHSSSQQAAQLLPQLVQRYLRELDSTGNAAYAVPRNGGGGSSSTTVFKSVPYPIAQLLLARLRSGGLQGAAEVSAEPMLALTPIRKQRGNQLKMANRFGKRDRLRMSNRFGRR